MVYCLNSGICCLLVLLVLVLVLLLLLLEVAASPQLAQVRAAVLCSGIWKQVCHVQICAALHGMLATGAQPALFSLSAGCAAAW
jgi:ABC-type sulfate transport system permease component